MRILIVIACAGCMGARTPAIGAELIGRYQSVTESECNIELSLAADEKATVAQTCRVIATGHDEKTITPASWSVAGHGIVVRYGAAQDTLRYEPALSRADYGGTGSGPGLELVGTVAPESRLSGYGRLWKR